jgi:DNA polymerase I-like protein with 3'-5' exonuclease and polymerase domains
LQGRVAWAVAEHGLAGFPRTATGKFRTSENELALLAGLDPFFRDLHDYKAAEKLLTTYLDKMTRPRLHPRFDVLKNTGRTSSFGDLNAQNLPRDDRVRRCLVPAGGHLLLDADYSTIEMATLAQSVLRQFGGRSRMAEAINAGRDLHRLVAARVTGKPEAAVTKEDRSRAKPINFGKPGGMGAARLREYARAGYGISLTEGEVAGLEAAWFALFPELRAFLDGEQDAAWELADRLDLTPAAYAGALGRRVHPDEDARAPAAWLGGMGLKVLRHPEPRKAGGEPYTPGQLDFLWERLQGLGEELGPGHRQALADRQAGEGLFRAVRELLGRRAVFTLTGRLRAGAGYCARHNTVFQGLAADGAKVALWRLWRAGYRLVNFIHDQVLVEVPEDADLAAVAADVERMMVDSMREVVPDVAVKVDWAYRRRWSKRDEDTVALPPPAPEVGEGDAGAAGPPGVRTGQEREEGLSR